MIAQHPAVIAQHPKAITQHLARSPSSLRDRQHSARSTRIVRECAINKRRMPLSDLRLLGEQRHQASHVGRAFHIGMQ
jgi:hypothetical protein